MNNAVIEVQNLSKHFRLGRIGATTLREDMTRIGRRLRGIAVPETSSGFWALRDVSFQVQPGEVLGIIGRNGAGKSTLLKILSRITEPTSGRAILRGRVASLLEVGTGFHPDLTGRENVFLNGTILGMKTAEIAARFDEIVAFAEVEKFIDTPVKHYSSGMRVRLAFAVAAHLDSEILIADEVLAVGDAAFQLKCLDKMRAISRQSSGKAILFVSHSMRMLSAICRTGLLLNSGRVEFSGPIKAVADRYQGQSATTLSQRFHPIVDRPCITWVSIDHDELARGHIVVEIEYASPYEFSPVPGLTVNSLDGVVLWGSNTRVSPPPTPYASSTKGTLRMRVDTLPLKPGNYLLSAWLGDIRQDHDEKLDVLQFTWTPGTETSPGNLNETVGFIDVPAHWSEASE